MNELKVFENPTFGQVRTIEIDNEPWFVGKDVAEALGYSNTRDALDRHVEKEDKNTVVNPDGNRGNPNMTIINESGLYCLILSSKLPGAKEFKRWVTSEVIPSIRKTGGYTLKPMTDYQKEQTRLKEENAHIRKAQILERLANQYEGAYRQILHAYATKELSGKFLLPLPKLEEKTYSATEIGQLLGITANRVGLLTNRYDLKTEQYGQWFKDKSRHSDKEVSSFRYFERVIPVLQDLLEQGAS